MINIRNYAFFSPQKCDCCKRVRKIKTKLEVMDEDGGLVGEVTLCPTCLKAFKSQKKEEREINAKQVNIADQEITNGLELSIDEYEDEDLGIEDYSKLGYQVEKLF